MGLIWKNLLSTPSTKRDQQSKKTQGYSYDQSRPLSPPIRGKTPYLGNGPIRLGGIAIKKLNPIRIEKKYLDTSSDSTSTSKYSSLDDFQILYTVDSRSSASSDPSNLRMRLMWRSSSRDMRSSRPNTSASSSSEALRKPLAEHIKEIRQEELQLPELLSKKICSSMRQNYSVDLLEAYSTINPSKEILQARDQANGIRSYGEDVANRNMAPEYTVDSLENVQESSIYVDSPELKLAKEIHLAKNVVKIIDTDQLSPRNHGDERMSTQGNHIKNSTYFNSHPLRSLITGKNDSRRPTTASARLDLTKMLSSPESVPAMPEKLLQDDDKSVKKLDGPRALPGYKNTHPKIKVKDDSKEKRVKLRRHTLSASTSSKVTQSLDQDNKDSQKYSQPLMPCIIKTSITASTKLKPKESFFRRLVEEPENARPRTGEKDTMVRGIMNATDISQCAIDSEINNFNNLKREKSDINSKSFEHDAAQQKSLRRNSETSSWTENSKALTSTNVLNPIIEETAPLKFSLSGCKASKTISRPKSRHEILHVSQNMMAAEAPIIPFNRNQSLYQSQNYFLTDIQVDKSNSPDPPKIVTTREKTLNHRISKDGSHKSINLFRPISKGKLNHQLDSVNKTINNEVTHGIQLVRNNCMTIEVDKERLEKFYGGNESSEIRSPSIYSYCDSDYSDLSDLERTKPLSDGEELLFGDTSNFGGMLPGLWIKHPVSGVQSSLGSLPYKRSD